MKKQLFLIIFIILPMVANADAVEIDGIYYTLIAKNDNYAEVTKDPNSYTGNIAIPESVSYNNVEYSVISIGNAAFRGCSGLTSVTIPNSVTSIGDYAFSGCSGLTSVTIPNSVTSIGNYAFQKCSCLTAVIIPNSVTSIGGSAFSGCSGLTSVTIPNSVTSIGSGAFDGCSGLTSVDIPNSVTTIGGSAFHGCSSLTSVNIPNSVTSIGSGAFDGCSGLTSVHITDLEAWCKILFIDYYSNPLRYANHLFLHENEVKDLVIPNNVTILDGTFLGCSGLTSVTIPNSVTSIVKGAFQGCSALTSVTIPISVTSIGWYAFNGCSGLTSVTIPNSVTSIGDCAFRGCSGLTSVTIPNSVTSIVYCAFYGCSGLTSVTIPNSVTSIGDCAFRGCSGLTSLTIGSNVKTIDAEAFSNCQNLADVTCLAENVPNAKSSIFNGSYIEYATLHVPAASVNAYKTTAPWSSFKNIVAIDGGEIPETPKCATPTISCKDGQLRFDCETEGVDYVSEITNTDIKKHYDATVPLTATYTVSVYATKTGYDNSDVATATLSWNGISPIMTGETAKYRLTFIVDNKELSVQNIAYGSQITAPTTDSEGNTVTWYTYPTTMPAHDLVVYGMVVKEPEPEVFAWLTVNDSRSGYTKIKVKQGAEQTLNFTAEEGWKISNIFMDGRYVTSRLAEDGTFVTPVITGDTSIIIVYEEEAPSDARAATRSQADIKVVSDGVVISNAEPQSRCVIYSSDGQQVVNTVINDGTRKIALQQGQVYILTINGRTLKFAL